MRSIINMFALDMKIMFRSANSQLALPFEAKKQRQHLAL
jgi:hypothetical protein